MLYAKYLNHVMQYLSFNMLYFPSFKFQALPIETGPSQIFRPSALSGAKQWWSSSDCYADLPMHPRQSHAAVAILISWYQHREWKVLLPRMHLTKRTFKLQDAASVVFGTWAIHEQHLGNFLWRLVGDSSGRWAGTSCQYPLQLCTIPLYTYMLQIRTYTWL